ncbi:MAG: sulfotransferase domain-containing protein [archaeon]
MLSVFPYEWDFTYLQNGFYAKQIENYLKYFEKNNMLFILFEKFINNQEEVFTSIFEFLEVKFPKDFSLNKKSNSAAVIDNELLSKMISSESELKIKMKKLIPKKLRKKIKSKLEKPFKKPKMKYSTYNSLIEMYKEDIKRLEKIIDRDLSHWLIKR